MNLASLILLALILLAVWYAIRTLRQNDGHTCGSCRGCDRCPHCKGGR